MHPKEQFKLEQKQLVATIRKKKAAGIQHPRESYEFRHRHIALCELRGRTRDQIERVVRDGNEANERLVESYKSEYTERFESWRAEKEAVCAA